MRKLATLIRSRWFETVIIIMGLFSLSFVTYDLVEEGKRQDCQTAVNQQFFAVTKQRSQIISADREALAHMIEQVLTLPTPEQRRQVLEDYLADKERRDSELKELPLPEITRC